MMANGITLRVQPVSLVDREDRQAVEVYTRTEERAFHALLRATDEQSGEVLCERELGVASGDGHARVMLPRPERARRVRWELFSRGGELLAQETGEWAMPREWKIYVMISSHTDIGLHNSQYIQRYNSSRFLKKAMALCDETASRAPEDRYRYTVEGTWFFENYPANHGKRAAKRLVRDYVKGGRIGVCAGVAGNHTQVYGLEELCRSTYGKSRIKRDWNVDCESLTMIDNNGLNWAMVQPYAEAGFKNILFAPNQWNPIRSSVWYREASVCAATWNTEGKGGGARIAMDFDSALPRIFYWQSADDGQKILVYSGGNYGAGATVFGLKSNGNAVEGGWVSSVELMADAMARNLPRIEARYPYDLWMTASYQDDQAPELNQTDAIAAWNREWKWPRFQTLGDPDAMMRAFRERYDGVIPTLRGDITGGWYQHPLSAPDLLAQKFEADRLLPTAEKLASMAALIDPGYRYPATAFERAWQALLCNDEHSYGTSGYQGRRVYETWMQHRAWIERAMQTARSEAEGALSRMAAHVSSDGEQVVVFNPTLQARRELVEWEGRSALAELPPFGYASVPAGEFSPDEPAIEQPETPPTVENAYYRVAFSADGGIRSIIDRELGRELLDPKSDWGANVFVYTDDNHAAFHTPGRARFRVERCERFVRVTAWCEEDRSGAAICQRVTLPAHEKQIEIDNRLEHVRGLFNDNRYNRYAYYAFPFGLENARRLCHLGGCVAEYGKDVTGHGTDVYMAANEWCCVQNEQMGIGLMLLDSELMEFDHIHPDKTDFGAAGEGAQAFCYLANDWLQMHVAGGDQLNFRFRYAITSFEGDYRAAGLAQRAERFAHPALCAPIGRQEGTLPGQMSFLSAREPARLVNLKRAEDGKGLIARLYGAKDDGLTLCGLFGGAQVERNTVDEQPMADDGRPAAFRTLRLGRDRLALPVREEPEKRGQGAAHTPIGATYTGLIDRPRAARGEKAGRMYLLWGRCMEKDLSHYELYRGETPDFACDERSLLARVKQEKYCVGRYIDDGLRPNTVYYYRVRAVDRAGNPGPLSEAFSGRTRE